MDAGSGEGLQALVLRRLDELGDGKQAMPALRAVLVADGMVSYETVRQIARGKHQGRLTDRVANGLAKTLRVEVAEVYQAAGLPVPQGPWVMPDRLERLTPRERDVVEGLAAAILESYRRGVRDGRNGA